ncbi:uncharacterized protein LOC121713566 [Alosa sapidissima]|uniref:uncharacterized protein LOC121713566 n=1 Tax=Alosa sapidissima TaxID=34773 RepID=UPI001C0918A8|nr:uncharacterized protein LOC121713566 [Alosa sapidissima]
MDQVLYSVVQFPNGGTAIVLQSWLRDNTLLWPPKKIPLAKALQQRMEPDSTWITYSDVRQLITCQTYEEARRGEHKYNTPMCATAEIESEEEKEEREKRKTKPNPLYMDSDSDEPSGEVKKPRVLRPPNVRVPESWSQLARNELPITNEEDFNEAEALLKTEAVRQKMIARLAMVGGTSSTCRIRRMLAAALTNGLACKFSWAGKAYKHSEAKLPFRDTSLQDCMFVASRQCDRKLTQQTFSDIVKNWLRYAPWRAGGLKKN